ncbi:hypothetical protein [Novosphingobium sp. ERN07]|uniref:hypothetical protein n=1 Tax=Novosphingobium sp. ERN07 TaxID=2726187 RepID=UPI001456B185|nr:hypothetical protein [Novosphingobium sp. ERN07]
MIVPQGEDSALNGDADLLHHIGASGLGPEALAIAALTFGVGKRHGLGVRHRRDWGNSVTLLMRVETFRFRMRHRAGAASA